MVSPSKNRKAKPIRKATNARNATRPQRGKHLHLLANKKFYLDLRSYSVSTKLAGRIENLGGVIENALKKEVNYFVTDRVKLEECSQNLKGNSLRCRASTSSCSVTSAVPPLTLDIPGDQLEAAKTLKASPDAMLERTCQKKEKNKVDVLDLAKQWGIRICPLDKVLKWLEKVEGLCFKKSAHSKNSTKSTSIKEPFIKFEACNKHYQPAYKELQCWPTINLYGCPASSPFATSRNTAEGSPKGKNATSPPSSRVLQKLNKTRMTRKAKGRLNNCEDNLAGLQNKSGYCEICKTKYSNIDKHVKSDVHLNFVRNEKNFLSIDHLIKEGPNIESFMKMNGAKDFSGCQLFGTRRSPRGSKVNRTWSVDNSLLWTDARLFEESNEDLSKRVLSEGHTRRPNLRYSVDERHMKGRKYSTEIHCNGVRHHQPTQLRPEKEEPVSEPVLCKTFQSAAKDEELSRNICISSGHQLRSRHVSARLEREENNSTITGHRLRHGRYSLGALCERNLQNYQLREPVKCEMVLRDRSKYEYVMGRNESSEEENFSDEIEEGKQMGSNKLQNCNSHERNGTHLKTSSHTIKKKRLSVEEKFLEDNKDYYKVEVLAAKLRSSGYFLSQRERELARQAECEQDELSINDDSNLVSNIRCNGGFTEVDKSEVKPKRSRRSELSVLSDEAESFMFGEPVKRDTSSDSSNSECEYSQYVSNKKVSETLNNSPIGDCDRTKPVRIIHDEESCSSSKCLRGNKCNNTNCECDSLHNDSSCADDHGVEKQGDRQQTGTKKKRRTQAEAFIRDNLDYYKFQLSESRLRFHDGVQVEDRFENMHLDGSDAHPLERKDVPNPMDIKEEEGEREGNDSGEISAKVEELQFSFESIPQSEPWYQTYQRQDEGEEFYISLSESCFYKPFLLPYEMPVDTFLVPNRAMGKRLAFQKKSKQDIFSKTPRKSPRCHASTLAILSSLMKDEKEIPACTSKKDIPRTATKKEASELADENEMCDSTDSKESNCVAESMEDGMLLISAAKTEVNSINSDFRSDSDNEINQIAHSIDALFKNTCGSEDTNPVFAKPARGRGRKRREKKKSSDSNSGSESKIEDVDPELYAEVQNGNTLNSADFPKIDRVPCPDVLSLLNFSHCQCVDRIASMVASGCSSCDTNLESNSECASTCDTVSEADSRRFGRRKDGKKRKINMTGWPRNKPKKKKKCDGHIEASSVPEKIAKKPGSESENSGKKCVIDGPSENSPESQGKSSPITLKYRVRSGVVYTSKKNIKISPIYHGRFSPRTSVCEGLPRTKLRRKKSCDSVASTSVKKSETDNISESILRNRSVKKVWCRKKLRRHKYYTKSSTTGSSKCSDNLSVDESNNTSSSSKCAMKSDPSSAEVEWKSKGSSETEEALPKTRSYRMVCRSESKNSLKLVIRSTTADVKDQKCKITKKKSEKGDSRSSEGNELQSEIKSIKVRLKSHKNCSGKSECRSSTGECRLNTRQSDRFLRDGRRTSRDLYSDSQGKYSGKFDRTSRTSIDSASSLEYQPCVRVEKIPDLGRDLYSMKGVHLSKGRRGISKNSGNKKTGKRYTSACGDIKKKSSINKLKNFKRRASPRKGNSQLIARWEVWPTSPS